MTIKKATELIRGEIIGAMNRYEDSVEHDIELLDGMDPKQLPWKPDWIWTGGRDIKRQRATLALACELVWKRHIHHMGRTRLSLVTGDPTDDRWPAPPKIRGESIDDAAKQLAEELDSFGVWRYQ